MPVLVAAALVTLRIYNYAAVPPAELAGARAAATRIFDAAGISTTWIVCRVPNSATGEACTEPLHDTGEFVVRLQRSAHASIPRHVALGSSLLDKSAGAGVLITLDPGLVATIASQAGVAPETLLGRAMAHEIGHLLLGTARHAQRGLMRATWSQRELQGDRAPDWLFSPDESALMLRALARALVVRR